MIILEKALQLANVNNLTGRIKAYVDKRIADVASAVTEVITELDTNVDNHIGNTTAHATAEEKTTWNDKANKTTFSVVTLSASGWASGVYTFTDYLDSEYDLTVEPDFSCTSDQLDAWGKAKILGNASSNKIKASGEVPTIDIPIILGVVRK